MRKINLQSCPMKCIRCRYIGATNTRGSRISVRIHDGPRRLYPIDPEWDSVNYYINCAHQFAEEMRFALGKEVVFGNDHFFPILGNIVKRSK